jgi:protein-S-isoprenylcysteine O-methyltransferase Ste14
MNKNTINFRLSFTAGILVLINGTLLGIVAKWFPTIMPTLPGTTGNDPVVLFTLSAVGLVLGILILLSAFILRLKPANNKILGLVTLVFSAPSVIMGGGFILGFLIGIYSGIMTIRLKYRVQIEKPKSSFSFLGSKDGMRIEGAGPKIMAPMFLTFSVTALISFLYNPVFNYPLAITGLTSWLGVLLLAIGLPFWLLSAFMFLKAWQRERLETRGPFAIMPNPIYSSFIIFVIPALSLLLGWWLLLLTSFAMYAAQRMFIHQEDADLRNKFGSVYEEYRRKVLLKFL